MITEMESSHINDVVKVHIESFPDSFLTYLGFSVLKVIYTEFMKSGFGYVFLDDFEVVGFLAGTFTPAKDFYRRLLLNHPVYLPILLILSVFRSPSNFSPIFIRAMNLLKAKSPSNGEFSFSEYEFILNSETKVAHALTMAVSPNYRRQGIANKLWAYLLNDLPQKGVTSILGSVISDNDATNRLYEKLGYRKIATKPRLDGKEEFKWLYYSKDKCTVTSDGYVVWNDLNFVHR